MTQPLVKKKLIEVALPLKEINEQSAREKSIRKGHPSTLHLWWARRPLAACRAVLFAQLVDDPSSRPEEFPTEAEQNAERKRLFGLIKRMVDWDNVNDKELFRQAHEEIAKCFDGNPPAILDPFCGGGSIPLEAQRLGLEAHASDLNPVAVLITKALIEIPPKFANQPPVWPGAAGEQETQAASWQGALGLAEDVRRYGAWMRDEAKRRIGHLYPKATLSDGSEANVIAWIWARTVTCPNPACGIEMPLMRSFWLSKKKGRERWVQPVVRGGGVEFTIHEAATGPDDDGTVGRQGARCVACDTAVPLAYIRRQGQEAGLGSLPVAVVAQGHRSREYIATNDQSALSVQRPVEVPEAALPSNPRDFKTPNYGLTTFADLFTNRQLVALTTFSDLVGEARGRALIDATAAGLVDAEGYANAIATYLAFTVSRGANQWSSLAKWHNGREVIDGVFARQAIPMLWDFAEANPLSTATAGFAGAVAWVAGAVETVPARGFATVSQADAATIDAHGAILATDPPYYDNIGYADLSDYFYVWLRRSLGAIYGDLFATVLTPKREELVATPYRFNGDKRAAKQHFESGFEHTFERARASTFADAPISIFYAFKQAEEDDGGLASTGWETLLGGLLRAGYQITATWPIRTELANRLIGSGTNALASSIVLICRQRSDSAEATNRRGLIGALRAELPDALRRLESQSTIAPVDMPQAAIGPGMAVFSRYSRVSEADGSDMTIRTALALINQALDEVLSEQEGDLDTDSRFCVKWFEQHGFDDGLYGDAETLATAINNSVEGLARAGVLRSGGGKVALYAPNELAAGYAPAEDDRVSAWEVVMHLARALETEGLDEAARILAEASTRIDRSAAKELTFRLHQIASRNGWTETAITFNGLGTSWNDIENGAREGSPRASTSRDQGNLFDSTGDGDGAEQ